MISPPEFAHPQFLILLASLPLLLAGQRRSLARFTGPQRTVCTVVRGLLSIAIILALAGVRALTPSSQVSVIFAIDGSASLSPEAARAAREFTGAALRSSRHGDTAGVIGFGRKATVWQPPVGELVLSGWPAVADGLASDLGGALDFAGALFPAGQSRRVACVQHGGYAQDDH